MHQFNYTSRIFKISIYYTLIAVWNFDGSNSSLQIKNLYDLTQFVKQIDGRSNATRTKFAWPKGMNKFVFRDCNNSHHRNSCLATEDSPCGFKTRMPFQVCCVYKGWTHGSTPTFWRSEIGNRKARLQTRNQNTSGPD